MALMKALSFVKDNLARSYLLQNILDMQDSLTYRSTNGELLSFKIVEAGVLRYEAVQWVGARCASLRGR